MPGRCRSWRNAASCPGAKWQERGVSRRPRFIIGWKSASDCLAPRSWHAWKWRFDRSAATDTEAPVSLSDMLPRAAVEIPLAARTRNSVITSMIEVAARSGWLWDPDKMAEAVRSREDLYPTALENGVAMLHPRRPLANILDRPFLALGRTDRGIPFASRRGLLTDVFFLICSVDDREHLRTLARLSRLLAVPTFLPELRGARSAIEVQEVIMAGEGALPN